MKLMDMCACMVGNSSSAVREGAFIGVPAVNIGSRQQRRLKGDNIIDVDPHSDLILNAIKDKLANGRYQSENIYGTGDAGKKIAEFLATSKLKIQKCLMY